MIKLLSDKTVKTIQPRDVPFEVRDIRVKGFLLRVQPSGSKSYYVEYTRGKRIRIGPASALKPDEARTEAIKYIAAWHKGEDIKGTELLKSAGSLGNYVSEIYEPRVVALLKTGKATCDRLRHSFADLMRCQLMDLSARDIEEWRTVRLKKAKPTTVNRDLNDLKAALNRAVDWGYLKTNPLTHVKPSPTDTNRQPRFLSIKEMEKLRAALDAREERIKSGRQSGNAWRDQRGIDRMPALDKQPFADYLKPMVLLSLNTGLRRGELFSLRWKDVVILNKPLDEGGSKGHLVINGATAKSGKTRYVELNSEAVSILRGWRKQSKWRPGLVFKSDKRGRFDNVRKSWAGVLKEAKIKNFRWHDLRHTFASNLVMKSVELNTVREFLGHSDIKMTLRYAHLAPEHKAAAIEKLVS